MEFGLVLVWLVVFLVLAAATLPVTAALLPDLEHGALSFPLALVVLGVVAHLVGQVAFGWPAVAAGVAVLVTGSLVASQWDALDTDPDLRGFAEAAVVFLAAFLLVVAIRSVDPAAAPLPVAVGEKFLDFGLLKSLLRAPVLRPEDMWFAGEPVRYYYGGHMLTALLSVLTETAGRFAYNLALAGFYATLVTTAYGLATSIATGHDAPRRLAGALAAFLVGLAGNLSTAARVVAWLLPTGVARSTASLVGLDPSVAEWTPTDFWYFEASRVLPIDGSDPDSFLAATEFPLFAWLNGDLHAHMMSQPFVLLAAALLLGYWRLPAERRRHRLVLLFGVLPPVAGLVGFVNLWSFPTVGGLTVLAVAFAPTDPARLLPDDLAEPFSAREGWYLEEIRRVVMGIAVAAVVLVLGLLWTLPFWLGPLPQSEGVAYWAPWTPLGRLLLVHGAFLAAFVPYLARRAMPQFDDPALVAGATLALALVVVLLGAPALGLLAPVLVATWWLLRTRTDVGFEAVLVLAGVGLVLVVELATVQGERFNTIFKPYADVWLFWAVGAAVALARLSRGAAARAPSLAGADADAVRWRKTGTVLVLAILLTTGLYPALALPTHFEDRNRAVENGGPTLDATAFVEVHYPEEAAAIRWLDEREGRPTIVTAAPGGYRWRPEDGQGASAPASLTGLPTVLGWFHERQYRGAEPYRERLGHVETIYQGPPERQTALLERYDVRYVYVGPAERASYTVTIGNHSAVEPAFQEDGVVVYAVDDDRL